MKRGLPLKLFAIEHKIRLVRDSCAWRLVVVLGAWCLAPAFGA